jgi:hypothetical protein
LLDDPGSRRSDRDNGDREVEPPGGCFCMPAPRWSSVHEANELPAFRADFGQEFPNIFRSHCLVVSPSGFFDEGMSWVANRLTLSKAYFRLYHINSAVCD